jgi:hypothetical protein
MTLAQAIKETRKKSRTDENGYNNLEVVEYINEGQKEFAKAVHGLTKEDYITITPLFDLQTQFAIRITIVGGTNEIEATDVAVCTTDAMDQTGTQVATALQATLRSAIGVGANLTVSWSTTAWKFTIDGIDCTSITFAAPSGITYASALDLLGLEAGTTTDTSVTGNIPEDCTVESALPSDFKRVVSNPEWDGNPLLNTGMSTVISPETSGVPIMYYIRNKNIRLYPPPYKQGILHIFYEYIPTSFTVPNGYQECGLSGISNNSSSGLTASTQYYFKVTIDGGTETEYDITTTTDVSFQAVMELMNDEAIGCTFEIVDGDLRCTSNLLGSASAISLAAGSTGTDLFVTIGVTDFDTAVATEAVNSLGVDDEYAMAIVYYAANLIAEDNYEYSTADRCLSQFVRISQQFIRDKANNNPKILSQAKIRPFPEVIGT